jgi:hypothetical protein
MKTRSLASAAAIAAMFFLSCDGIGVGTRLRDDPTRKIIDHADADVDGITGARIAKAKGELVVAYWHTSHGNQILAGNVGMDHFFGDQGWYTLNGEGGLRLSEPGGDVGSYDDSSPHNMDNATSRFQQAVRDYLAENPATNVVMASWCGQLSYETTTSANVDNYLRRMSELEDEYPSVAFVYMTGHADGAEIDGQLPTYDRKIRAYCAANGKWLYDFYDIECYDPEGEYYGDKLLTDNCDYDSDGIDGQDSNWATNWQDAHHDEWWDCSPDHTQPLNGNRKAMAAWQLWCAIADGM